MRPTTRPPLRPSAPPLGGVRAAPSASVRAGAGRPGAARPGTGRVRRRPRGGGGMPWWGWTLIGIGVSVLLGFGAKFAFRGEDDAKVRRQAHELIAEIPDYREHAAYYDELVDRCHAGAFSEAYTVGGPRQRNRFDENTYLRELFTRMAESAERDGHGEMGVRLRTVASHFR